MSGSAFAVLTAGLPAVVVTAAMLQVAAAERTGRPPSPGFPFLNSAEAAASGDPARTLLLLRMGDNPTRIHSLRPDMISSRIIKATTLEAALWARKVEMIQVLDREGALVDPDQRRELACLALDLDLPDVATYLTPEPQCVKGAALARIIARSGHELHLRR